MASMIENSRQAAKSDIEATKQELLLHQAGLEIKVMERIGDLKK